MDIYQLEQFKVVAELQHMTKAAEILSVSQPALSRTIRNIESEYNTSFFDHMGKRIILNEKGEIFLKYVNQVLSSMHMAGHEIREQIKREDTSINLVIQAGGMLIADIIQEFRKEHPEVFFQIVQYDTWILKSPAPDLILSSSIQPLVADRSYTLLREDILLAVPADHPLAREDSVCLRQFAQEPLIAIQNGSLLAANIKYHYKAAGFEPHFVMDHYTSTTISDMVSLGMGFAFVPALTWTGIDYEKVRLLKISDVPFQRYINLTWPDSNYISKISRTFRNFLLDYFTQLALRKDKREQGTK